MLECSWKFHAISWAIDWIEQENACFGLQSPRCEKFVSQVKAWIASEPRLDFLVDAFWSVLGVKWEPLADGLQSIAVKQPVQEHNDNTVSHRLK